MEVTTPRLRSTHKAVNINGFFAVVGEAVVLQQKADRTAASSQVKYGQAFPLTTDGKFDTRFVVVRHSVLRGVRAAMTNRGQAPRGPMERERKPHPDMAGYLLVTTGQAEEYEVQFSITAKTPKEADELVEWFKGAIINFTIQGFFIAHGIEQFFWLSREADRIDKEHGAELFTRDLIYHVRLDVLRQHELKTLDAIHLTLSESSESVLERYEVSRG